MTTGSMSGKTSLVDAEISAADDAMWRRVAEIMETNEWRERTAELAKAANEAMRAMHEAGRQWGKTDMSCGYNIHHKPLRARGWKWRR